MTNEEVLQYNKRCAEFLGYLQHGRLIVISNIPTHVSNGKFHSDWNWIMEVVEAIENKGYDVAILSSMCRIYLNDELNDDIITYVHLDKKEAVVKAINEFLVWYQKESHSNTAS